MDQTEKLLNCVSRNALTGANATSQLISRTQDAGMRRELAFQEDQYRAVHRQTADILKTMGKSAETPTAMAKMGMWMGIMKDTMADKSSAHIADIMIQGAVMGITDTTQAKNECADASAEAQGIAANFVTQQQDSIERMKQFLK